MRRSIDELRTFYGEPTGALARRLLAARLAEAWGTAEGADVLGLGYATPWLGAFRGARRIVAAMPGSQGAEKWTSGALNRSTLVNEYRLPFVSGLFDRILLVHAIEEAEDPQALLVEATRTLAPAGRLIVACAARGGMWSHSENTPFGHGRPFSLRQLEGLVRAAGLEPTARSQALFVPPWRPILPFADGIEQAGRLLAPGTASLILLEATRYSYARPRGNAVAVAREARPALAHAPRPASRDTAPPALCTTTLPQRTTAHSTEGGLAPQRKPLYGGSLCTD